jgi:hypothetical protein
MVVPRLHESCRRGRVAVASHRAYINVRMPYRWSVARIGTNHDVGHFLPSTNPPAYRCLVVAMPNTTTNRCRTKHPPYRCHVDTIGQSWPTTCITADRLVQSTTNPSHACAHWRECARSIRVSAPPHWSLGRRQQVLERPNCVAAKCTNRFDWQRCSADGYGQIQEPSTTKQSRRCIVE